MKWGFIMFTNIYYPIAALLCSLFLIFVPLQAFSQQPEEAEQLESLVGNWEYENMRGDNQCEWLGEVMVHCKGTWVNEDGKSMDMVFVIKYNEGAELYTSDRFYSNGYSDSGKAWVDGDTLTIVYEGASGGRYKVTNKISEDTWTYKWHISVQGGPWKLMGNEGSAKKVD